MISIIIPNYNSSNTLERLLKSIQKYNDDNFFEIIVIDDKSKDNEVTELLKLQKSYNFKLFCNRTSFKGPGTCRNIGLLNSTQEWILFADSDDYFKENFRDIIFDSLKKYSNAEIIYFVPTSKIENSDLEGTRHKGYKKLVLDYLNDDKKEKMLRFHWGGPCSKLIKKELINKNNICFDNTLFCEDGWFSIRAAFWAKTIAAISKPIYIISQSKTSLSTAKNYNDQLIKIDATIKINNFLKMHGEKEYITPVFIWLLQSYKLGVRKELSLLKYIKRKKVNPFEGIFNYIKKYL